MGGTKSSIAVRLIKLLPILGVAVFIAAYLACGREISLSTLLSYTPKKLLPAALFMMALYAAKCMTVFFPILVLEVLGGIIFPTDIAIAVNLLGNVVTYTLGYFIGRFSSSGITLYLIKKQPRLRTLYDRLKGNRWFMSFFLRAISCLPGDLVSMYLGSQGISYLTFITGSMVGSLIGILAATVIGATMLNPASPAFIISVAVRISIALLSLVFHEKINKRRAG